MILNLYLEDVVDKRGKLSSVSYISKEGINRVYFPDFFIKPVNTILKIKSEWTIQLKTCRLEEKTQAVLTKEYKYEVWVYDSSKKNKQVLTFKKKTDPPGCNLYFFSKNPTLAKFFSSVKV